MKEGDVVKVFDTLAWGKKGDLPEGNAAYYRKASILELREDKGMAVADVRFLHNRYISIGHFVSGIKEIKKNHH